MTPPPAQPLSLRLDNVLPMVNPRHVQLIGPQASTGPPLAVFRILVGHLYSSLHQVCIRPVNSEVAWFDVSLMLTTFVITPVIKAAEMLVFMSPRHF